RAALGSSCLRLRSLCRWHLLQPRQAGPAPRRGKATTSSAVDGLQRLKTLQELPGPGVLGSMYWYLIRGYILHTHQLQVIHKKLYGPLWKYVMGKYTSVAIASPELMEKVLRQEGRFPTRCDMALWKEHRDLRGLAYGPLTEDGERWHRLRQVLNQRMLKPSAAVLYAGAINEVVSDLMVRLQDERAGSPSGVLVRDVANVLYRFALEGTRGWGVLERAPAGTSAHPRGVDLSQTLWWGGQRLMPHLATVPASILGRKMIDRRVEEIAARLEKGEEPPRGGTLTYLLSSGNLSIEEVNGSVAELLMAGVDTTSNTLAWALYHLAQEPETQEALYREVTSVVPRDCIPSAPYLAKMPLLKAVIKETLRLYPVVPANSRVVVEKDIVLWEYHFPKGTMFAFGHFALSRDESNFPEPDKFLPRRWLREHSPSHHPFSSIPFGYGVRACVGRRIAELEMHLALARIIQTFELRPDPELRDVKPLSRIVLVANKPINLQLLDRQTDIFPAQTAEVTSRATS
uniref:Cytochrome P450 family 27 subfamily A member 24 n=1 Tax=Sphenodon punctatus TaxID=8508 RepID=A0A8D0HAL8_SPHPU